MTDTAPMPEDQFAALRDDLRSLRGFIDRRFHEVSAELSASVSIMEAGDEENKASMHQLRGLLSGLLERPEGGSALGGLDLNFVIEQVQGAATRIMDLADLIGAAASECGAAEELREKLDTITTELYTVCEFSDLVTQRIQRVHNSLSGVLPADDNDSEPAPTRVQDKTEINQGRIDSLLNQSD